MSQTTDPPLAERQATELPLRRLLDLLVADRPDQEAWRRGVLVRMAHLRDLLVREVPPPAGWLEARRSCVLRERTRLLNELSVMRMQVLADDDVDRVVIDLHRLVADVRHHLQRIRDLVYDEVEFEVGGSE